MIPMKVRYALALVFPIVLWATHIFGMADMLLNVTAPGKVWTPFGAVPFVLTLSALAGYMVGSYLDDRKGR